MATQIDPAKLAERLRREAWLNGPRSAGGGGCIRLEDAEAHAYLTLLAEAVELLPDMSRGYRGGRKVVVEDWLRRVAEATGGEE